jgi:glycosyltransferase involved in cell wall biosynthesis
MPLVSICIPTYNRKDYLSQTLSSVFAQTYKDYEVVIVDDGSTDGTGEMIKQSGHSVRYYWQQNTGDAAARNKLIELAGGRYISFLDSDDLLVPDAIERMMAIVDAQAEDVIVYGPYIAIDRNGQTCKVKHRNLYSGYIAQHLFENILVHSCGSLFPKKILEEAGRFDMSLPVCSDYALWLELSLKYRFIALPEPTFERRRHTGSLSKRTFANRRIELGILEKFYYDHGGKECIPKKNAMKRLSREGYRAGRCALREGLTRTACELLSQSFHRYPDIKSIFWWVVAAGRLCFGSYRK